MKKFSVVRHLSADRVFRFVLCSYVCVAVVSGQAKAQSRSMDLRVAGLDTASLPDAPLPVSSSVKADGGVLQASGDVPSIARTVHTGPFDMLIDPEEIAPKLTSADKIGMGLKASVSPFAVIGWIGSATYSEAFNRSPNYGQSAADYGQRLGAAAARASSESIFSISVMAPILHEDPRYFVEGPGHSGVKRTVYALSRVFITRRDDGRDGFNYALLSGNAIGAGLTQTYYPSGNRNFRETASTFGVSLAGSGVKFLFEEFFYKEASVAQLKRRF